MSDNQNITSLIHDHQQRLQAIEDEAASQRETEAQRFRAQLAGALPESFAPRVTAGERLEWGDAVYINAEGRAVRQPMAKLAQTMTQGVVKGKRHD